MAHLVFVESTGLGVAAMEYARACGDRVTFLWSPLYEFTAPRPARDRARAVAHRAAPVADIHDLASLRAALAATDPGPVDAVLSTLSYCTPEAAELAAAIGARGTSADAVATARDKGRCRAALDAAGLPNLAFAVVETAAEALAAAARIGYPVIVKPVLGIGKAVTAIATSPAEIAAHFAGAEAELRALEPGIATALDGRSIVEELAVGQLYSVEVATDGSTFVPLVAVGRKTGAFNPVLELGCTVPSGLPDAEEAALGAYAVAVCRAAGLDLGVFHVEVMRTPAGFRLIEINPRLTGGSLPDTINAVADADVFAILVDLFAGRPVDLRPLTLRGAASHSFLAAAADSVLPADLPPDWFDEFRARVHSGYARVGAGDPVPLMKGNFDSFGMLRAVAADPASAEAACAGAKEAVERRLGIPLLADGTQARPALDRA